MDSCARFLEVVHWKEADHFCPAPLA